VAYASGGYYATSLAVADVNADGKLDLLVANECAVGSNCSTSGGASVLLGNGDGTFRAALTYGSGGQFPYSVAVGDLNGDGKPDLLLVNQCADSVCANGALGVLLGNGTGNFPAASSTTIPAYSFASLALADFDGDGKMDVASAGAVLLLGNGDGSFQNSLSLGFAGFGIVAGDFNRDGRPDLALGGVSVLLNTDTQGLKTTASLASSLNPSSFGQAITFTARVAPHGTYSPTGSVVFKDGATVLGTMSLSSRHTTFTTSALSGGNHSITASYSGDSNFLTAVSSALNQQIAAATTVTALTSSTAPISLNQSVTYTARVTSQYGGVATGTVTFKDRSKTIAVVPVASGQASYSTSYSTAGTQLMTAVYSGDVSNSGSTSPVLSVYVESGPVASKTVITTSASPSLVSQLVTFTATITSSYGSIPDGGSVNFYDGTVMIGSSGTLGGVATLSTSALLAKTHTIKATYLGNASFKPSLGLVQQVVLDFNSSITVTAAPSPSAYGQAVMLTATVTSTAPGGPTGMVTFKSGTSLLGTAELNSGTASLSTKKLVAGVDTITASYNGDTRSAKSAEAMTDTVHQATSVAALASSLNPSPAGRIVRLTATVNSPTTVVTGSVTFMDGANVLATVSLAGGKATYGLASLSPGTHKVTAVYHGTANIAGCTSPQLVETVN
jgi:Bacterial Ig-like domain (group 3)/FG-GAP-like repeat